MGTSSRHAAESSGQLLAGTPPSEAANSSEFDRARPAPPVADATADLPDERASGSIEYLEPPRERLEWLLAASRLLFVGGALLAVVTAGGGHPRVYPLILMSLGIYLAYSLGILALVWRPLHFGRGWAVILHAFDLAAFSWLTLITAGITDTFLMSYVFLVICGTLRWQMWGALVTGAISIALFTVAALLGPVVGALTVSVETFVTRSTQLAIMSALLGYLGAYHQRYQREITRLSAWPRRITEDRDELISEIVTQCARVLDTPRVLLVWEEPGEGSVNLASVGDNNEVVTCQEPEGFYETLVMPRLEQASFQASNASDDHGRVVYRAGDGFRQRICRPMNEALRARFNIKAVQSWPLEGELVRGRLFAMDSARLEIDALSVGLLVARLAASRLDGLYALRDLRNAAALRERVRVASDLHDSLLQSLAGVGLQLMVARRMLQRDPSRAVRHFDDIQKQIEQGELEMRAFIRRMRPHTTLPSEARTAALPERLENLGRRLERQWSVKLHTQIDAATDQWADGFADEVFRITREAILNAARHSDASAVTARIGTVDSVIRLEIADDGGGFPFRGTYDLNELERLNEGPWSVKERVSALLGTLELTSTDDGSRLVITLPVVRKAG